MPGVSSKKSLKPAENSPWIFGGPVSDFWIFAGPFLFSALLLVLFPRPLAGEQGQPMPLWAFLLIVVGVDVAHVWGTLFRTYLDPDTRRQRWKLLWLSPPVIFLASFFAHWYSPVLFWTGLAYIAIHHFMAQQYGLLALYRVKAGERSRFDYHLDKWVLYAGALGPVLAWHASPDKGFDWFSAGEQFVVTLPADWQPVFWWAQAGLGLFYGGRQIFLKLSGRDLNVGKLLILVLTWISWSVGIWYSGHPLVSAAFINLFHGVPFLALVWLYGRNRWQKNSGGTPLLRYIFAGNQLLVFLAILIGLALVEEFFWEVSVWKNYFPDVLSGWGKEQFPAILLSALVALLSLPQAVHYYLDRHIWRFDGSNPGLPGYLGLK